MSCFPKSIEVLTESALGTGAGEALLVQIRQHPGRNSEAEAHRQFDHDVIVLAVGAEVTNESTDSLGLHPAPRLTAQRSHASELHVFGVLIRSEGIVRS